MEEINCVPSLALCIRVDNTLSVTVFVAGKQVNNRRLQWILPTGDKLERWSQLEIMISHYGSKDDTTEATDKASEYIIEIDKACSILKQGYEDMTQTDDVISGDVHITCLLFCIEQLRLLCIPCCRRRYSSDFLRFAYVLFLRSSSCYSVLYKLGYVILPHMSTLRKLVGATGATIGVTGEDHAKYLKLVASKLSDREKYVVLQLDEIHVSAGYFYKGGSIVGAASNVSHEAAQTVQAFMISSLFGASKEIVSLNAVKNLSADVLHKLLTDVIYTVQNAGFIVVVVIADNNQINSKAFQAYCGKIPPAEGIENTQHPGSQIFFCMTLFTYLNAFAIIGLIRQIRINHLLTRKCLQNLKMWLYRSLLTSSSSSSSSSSNISSSISSSSSNNSISNSSNSNNCSSWR